MPGHPLTTRFPFGDTVKTQGAHEMIRCLSTILLGATICLVSFQQATAEAGRPVFRAGAAKADITPANWPLPMLGSFSLRLAEKAWDPLYARAIVVANGKTKIAVVVVDSCYCPRSLFDEAKRRIAKIETVLFELLDEVTATGQP